MVDEQQSVNMFYTVHIELVHPIRYGSREKSYLEYQVKWMDQVEETDNDLTIRLPEGNVKHIPASNVAMWSHQIHKVEWPVEGAARFQIYDEPTGGYAGWYDNAVGECVAFLTTPDDEIVYMKDLK